MSSDSMDRQHIQELKLMAQHYASRGRNEKAKELLDLARSIEQRLKNSETRGSSEPKRQAR